MWKLRNLKERNIEDTKVIIPDYILLILFTWN